MFLSLFSMDKYYTEDTKLSRMMDDGQIMTEYRISRRKVMTAYSTWNA